MNFIVPHHHRYYAILHPMRARYKCTVKLARRIVLILWALSVVMALPILVGQVGFIPSLSVRSCDWSVSSWYCLSCLVFGQCRQGTVCPVLWLVSVVMAQPVMSCDWSVSSGHCLSCLVISQCRPLLRLVSVGPVL